MWNGKPSNDAVDGWHLIKVWNDKRTLSYAVPMRWHAKAEGDKWQWSWHGPERIYTFTPEGAALTFEYASALVAESDVQDSKVSDTMNDGMVLVDAKLVGDFLERNTHLSHPHVVARDLIEHVIDTISGGR